MLSTLYHAWFMEAAVRKEAAISCRKIPAWGLGAWFSARILSICLSLWFRDRGWFYFRGIFSSEEYIELSHIAFEAYEKGIRSLSEYNHMEYLRRADLSRRQRLLQSDSPLALPEGPESMLTAEIHRLEKDANKGCGCYFELYHVRLLNGLRVLNAGLTEYERTIFNRLLSDSGWDISDESYEAACREENEVLAEIHADCV